MANYIEQYSIPGCGEFGIEDYESRGDHFLFQDKKRFQVWHNGCGINNVEKIETARERIFQYAKESIRQEILGLSERLSVARATDEKLNNDVFNLGRFRK